MLAMDFTGSFMRQAVHMELLGWIICVFTFSRIQNLQIVTHFHDYYPIRYSRIPHFTLIYQKPSVPWRCITANLKKIIISFLPDFVFDVFTFFLAKFSRFKISRLFYWSKSHALSFVYILPKGYCIFAKKNIWFITMPTLFKGETKKSTLWKFLAVTPSYFHCHFFQISTRFVEMILK